LQELGRGRNVYFMNELKIEYKKISDLKPYAKNARKHTVTDVTTIVNSIRDFGMNDPIGIWGEDNLIVEGHGRLLACKELGIKEVPTIRLDHLSDEQRRAYTLAHNKTAEMSDWDFDVLNLEIEDIFDFDMEDYGFELFDAELEHEEQQEVTQSRLSNIENLGIAQYNGNGYYDIPEILPVYTLPEITEWIGFNYVLSDENPAGKGVHFFIDDYQFERVWNTPEKYVDKLKQYTCVIAPDFSPYGDMPMALQIYNHYRKHWVASYWQEQGITVIPAIRASTDDRSFDWYLDGEPHGGIVCISSMWTSNNEDTRKIFEREYNTMYDTLKPCKTFIYGRETIQFKGDVEYIKSFSDARFNDKK